LSANGNVVVGSGPVQGSFSFNAFRWTTADGNNQITTLLQNAGVTSVNGWTLHAIGNAATGVSADGTTVTGYGTDPNGRTQAWIARLPSPNPLVAAVLPASRSVQVGSTATAFATVINAGTTAATNCSISAATSLPLAFVYQTTDPATNALTGNANTPVTIAAGGSQSFVIALTPSAAFAATQVQFNFSCVTGAPVVTGVNTLLMSASTTPTPDIVALGATTTNDGILHITGTTGSAAFAVATVNLGASSAITVTANTGSATLPLAISLCQTVPSTGACIAAPSSSVTTTINGNATPTFAFFGTASGAIPFSPAVNRIFAQFTDSTNAVRGSTSVAVETQ
jgi:hypothetical protein